MNLPTEVRYRPYADWTNEEKTKIKENKTLEEQMICPKCHGSLIERNGKYGPFIGCSNYPKCKFIKKIN